VKHIVKSGDPLTMSYFDNFDNEPLNKYKINFKNEKKIAQEFSKKYIELLLANLFLRFMYAYKQYMESLKYQ
jgi:hypothetical protein